MLILILDVNLFVRLDFYIDRIYFDLVGIIPFLGTRNLQLNSVTSDVPMSHCP